MPGDWAEIEPNDLHESQFDGEFTEDDCEKAGGLCKTTLMFPDMVCCAGKVLDVEALQGHDEVYMPEARSLAC